MDFKSIFKTSPLHDAIATGDIDSVRQLLDQGADVNGLDQLKRTPLEVAVSGGQKEFTNLMKGLSSMAEGTISRTSRASNPIDLKETLSKISEFDPKKFMGMQYRIREFRDDRKEDTEDDTAIAGLLLQRGARVDGRDDGGATPLICAARSGNISTMRLLIEHGADVNAADSEGSALFAACQTACYDAVRLLLDCGADGNFRTVSGATALHPAARGGSIMIARVLLSLGLDVNAATQQGTTPLSMAAMYGQTEMADFLRDKRAAVGLLEALALEDLETALTLAAPSVSARDLHWAFPILRWAIKTGKPDIVRILMHKGVTVDPAEDDGRKLLRLATLGGNEQIVALLLPKGSSVAALDLVPDTVRDEFREPADKSGRTKLPVLGLAVWHNNISLAKLLISRGADVNAPGEAQSLLSSAVLHGHTEMVNLLLDSGAKVDGCDGEHLRPLGCAIMRDDLEVVKLLLSRGADPRAGGGFSMAMAFNKPEIQKILKEHTGADLLDLVETGEAGVVRSRLQGGQNPDTRNEHGTTTLMTAAKAGQIEMVRELIEYGADVNARNDIGMTALYFAVGHGHPDIARLLISRGAEVEVSTKTGNTPILAAATGGRREMVDLLVGAGATVGIVEAAALGDLQVVNEMLDTGIEVDLRAADGSTALMTAAGAGSIECIDLLLQRGADINSFDNLGHSALCHAVLLQRNDAVERLLAAGADVNAAGVNTWMTASRRKRNAERLEGGSTANLPDWMTREDAEVKGDTPLQIAVIGDPAIIAILLGAGADINCRSSVGERTPLSVAASLGRTEVVKLLLERGADVHAKGLMGETALDAARSDGKYPEIVALLQAAATQADRAV